MCVQTAIFIEFDCLSRRIYGHLNDRLIQFKMTSHQLKSHHVILVAIFAISKLNFYLEVSAYLKELM